MWCEWVLCIAYVCPRSRPSVVFSEWVVLCCWANILSKCGNAYLYVRRMYLVDFLHAACVVRRYTQERTSVLHICVIWFIPFSKIIIYILQFGGIFFLLVLHSRLPRNAKRYVECWKHENWARLTDLYYDLLKKKTQKTFFFLCRLRIPPRWLFSNQNIQGKFEKKVKRFKPTYISILRILLFEIFAAMATLIGSH